MISALISSLGIISSGSAPDDWAIFPIESYVFAFGSSNVSVVRMRIEISDPDGAMPGNYASEVVWKGGLSQWNQKVQALKERARTMDLSACHDQPVTECEAKVINVVFSPREREDDQSPIFRRPRHRVFDPPRRGIETRTHLPNFSNQ
jgi:hypothetical protein